MSVLRAQAGRVFGPPHQARSPGLGRVALRLEVASQSESDGLALDLTHPLSLSDANTPRVAVRPGYPNPVQPVRHTGTDRERIAPPMRRAGVKSECSWT